MNIRRMERRCPHCHRLFTYNPSAGDFGRICKHCGFVQTKPTISNRPLDDQRGDTPS